MPTGKRCRVMLWSGAANPDAAALAAARAAGCLNMNGGLFRWDELHDSVGFVSPWGATIGDEFQVFAGAPNENIFDGFYTTMPGAFAHVDRTIENTGRDRILKPANVYVHFYSAEHPARLLALERLLERWLDREPVMPVPASTYAGAVLDCQRCCAVTRVDGGFRLTGFEHCRTVRFDSRVPAIDWSRSAGLAGVHRLHGRTFVHLAAATAEVRFLPDGVASRPQPHIEQADCELDRIGLLDDGVEFTAPAGIRRAVVIAGLPVDAAITVAGLPGPADDRRRSDAEGRLELRLPAGEPLSLRVLVEEGSR
ncbi:MAG: hypothetical protein KDC98_23770 [Planctomycetes bacterium]|nr:hypothetical protein [Planctomycetota bacterium]